MRGKKFLLSTLVVLLIIFPAFRPLGASNGNEVPERDQENSWWKAHTRWTQWLAGTLGGIVGSIVGTTVFSLASYPIFSIQEGVFHPQLSGLYFGSMVGYPVGSALGAGYGVEKSGKLMGQEGNHLRIYLTSGIAAGVTFYGSPALGAGLNSLTGENSAKGIYAVFRYIPVTTPIVSSTAATWNYRWGK